MSRGHGSKEDSRLQRIHILLHPFNHSLECHTVSIFALHLNDPLLLILERTFPSNNKSNKQSKPLVFEKLINFIDQLQYIQDLHLETSPPPQVGIEHNNVSATPVPTVNVDRALPHDPIRHSMNSSVIRIRFEEKRCPVELNRCIVILY